MSRKPSSKPSTTIAPTETGKYHLPSDAKWGGFINVKLTDEDRAAFDAWQEMLGGNVWPEFEDILAKGMKAGVSYDNENECFVCTFTGKLVSNSNERYCITSRAGTWETAIATSVWKLSRNPNGYFDGFLPKTGKMTTWG